MKLTKQGVRDLNDIKPASKHTRDALDETNFRQAAARAIAKYSETHKFVDELVWSQIISFYNAEIDRLTAELARAKKENT